METEAEKIPEEIIPVMLKGVPRDFEYNNYKKKRNVRILKVRN
jgi:hypothetical protein